MTRFKKMVEGKNGWTEWIEPKLNGYMLECCDCGVVHELQFKVMYRARRERIKTKSRKFKKNR